MGEEHRINAGFSVLCLAMAAACFVVFVLLPILASVVSKTGNGGW